MSAATQIDPKAHIIGFTNMMTDMLLNDLDFIPKDKLDASPMGVARTPRDFVAECAGFSRYVAWAITGEPKLTEEERKVWVKGLDTIDKAINGLKFATKELVEAIESQTQDQLASEVMTPWGTPTTKFGLANMAAAHVMYHNGQVNYIQSLYGDADNHWA